MRLRRLGAGVAGAAALIAAVTALARLAGFGRTVVFSQTVGDTCVGTAYVTANQLPTVLFEVAIGGALAGMVVPVLASAAARGDRRHVAETASALVTWVVLAAVPLSALLAAAAVPAMAAMLGPLPGCDRGAVLALAARFLAVFAPQVLFYGLAAVLYGVLQAHRAFLAPALAPLVSSLVVMAAYTAFVLPAGPDRGDPARLPVPAELVLSVGTTLGVAAMFLTVVVPVARLRLGLRPRLRFPPGVGRRVRSLAAAALLPLVAMQLSLLLSVALANWGGGAGRAVLYNYAWALFTLPYGVVAVPIATSAFTALSVRHGERDTAGFASVLSAGVRAVVVLTGGLATALAAAAGPVAELFARQDPLALERALPAYALGIVGFGLVALLSRALYASGHGRRAALAQIAGWAVVMAAGAGLVAVLPSAWTVAALGAGTAAGLTLAAVLLAAGVRAAHGPGALAGAVRSLLAAALGAGCGFAAGWHLAGLLDDAGAGPLAALAAVAASGGAALAVYGAVAGAVDVRSVRAALGRLRAMAARKGEQDADRTGPGHQ
ncbi:murein biosynthesis integral membrane protein MurJ [Nocardiopsis halophila]|uniref:murein biosynthesis integral membrane protein MurJ n=1 Tax=Nocardiopsis halophila TaxID=141692 RepID=UPI0003479558|nr:lipid II flippase MurJ [Nocardiopsis halophila]